MTFLRRTLIATAAAFCVAPAALAMFVEQAGMKSSAPPVRVPSTHLLNAFRITEQVLSGGLPEGDAAFRELADLGVKTVISVDGMTPDVATARQHGLRYVHLPHGYDRVPLERGKELAKAVRDLPGPVYIHCHHGKHRSPAAAAVACIEAGLIPPEAGETILKTAGTSPNYRGLYDSVRQSRPLSNEELDRLSVEFRETSPVPPLAEAMVELEHAFDRVKRHRDSKWTPRDDARSAALLLLEHYREMQRLDVVKNRPAGFRTLLTANERTAETLETSLAGEQVNSREAEAALKTLADGCSGCHRDYRDTAN